MYDFTPADMAQLAAVGITPEAAAAQVAQLRNPPRPIRLVRPATIGDGITRFTSSTPQTPDALMAEGVAAADAGRVLKFVPASGAATRMFKQLIDALQTPGVPSQSPGAAEFFARLDDFPFAAELRRRAGVTGAPASESDERTLLRTLLMDMGLASVPKALVPFHRNDRVRTAFEEQLHEGVHYARDVQGVTRLHFTVPADARAAFEATLRELRPVVEVASAARGIHLSVQFSVQSAATDTLALDADGAPFRAADGSLLLRPSGHGALLANLQDCGGELVVVKNIDNILPREQHAHVARWKHLLIGYLAHLQADVVSHLAAITGASASRAALDAARHFANTTFARRVPADAGPDTIIAALNRPLRVCGVVSNDGEPGGAPFWVQDADGRESLQIVESAQVDLGDAGQSDIFRAATHFNPVDLVCSLRDFRGEPFDLAQFVDADTAFVTGKAADGRPLIALERPGLWNGSMAGWNTRCVEVPASTFAPVKTVFDLLRPQHQPTRADATGAPASH